MILKDKNKLVCVEIVIGNMKLLKMQIPKAEYHYIFQYFRLRGGIMSIDCLQ